MSLVTYGRRRPALFALEGLVLLLVLLLLCFNLDRLPFTTGARYSAEFGDASGLQPGEEVRVAGLKVGTVRKIALGGTKVVVTFDVEDVELGRYTRAGIEVKTLLGQHYLSVTPAGPGRLPEGTTIPLSRTSTPVNVVPAFQQLTTEVRDIDTRQLATAFESMSSVLARSAPEVRGTLTGLARLSESVASRDEEVRTLFRRANGVTGVLAARDKELGQLLTSSDQVLQVLDARRETIRKIILDTSRLARQLRGLIADNRARLGPALDKLDRVLRLLKRNRQNIDDSIRLTGVYGRTFTNVGGSGKFFDGTLKYPTGLAVCNSPENDTALDQLLQPVLSKLNETVNHSSQPCLPLGPAAASRMRGNR